MNKLQGLLLAGLLAVSSGCKKQEPTDPISIPSISRSTTNSPRRMTNRFQIPSRLVSENVTNNFNATIFQRGGKTFYVESNYYNAGELPWFLRGADETTIDSEGNLRSDYIYGIVSFKNKTNITLSTHGPEGVRAIRSHELNPETESIRTGYMGEIVLDKHLTGLDLGTNSYYTPGKSPSSRDNKSLGFYVIEEGPLSFNEKGEVTFEGRVYHPVKMKEPSRMYPSNYPGIMRTNIPSRRAVVGQEK